MTKWNVCNLTTGGLPCTMSRSYVGSFKQSVRWLLCVSFGLGCSVRAEQGTAPMSKPAPNAVAPRATAAVSGTARAPDIGAKSEMTGSSTATRAPATVKTGESADPSVTNETATLIKPVSAEGSAALGVEEILGLDGSTSTSVGGPSAGRVLGSIAIPDRGPGFYHNPKRPYEARFGAVELVQAIVRAAAIVDREMPGSVLVVNDLGLQEGGPIRQHGSHQAGRDADILFYSLTAQGEPLPSVGVPIDPKGKGVDFKDLSVPDDDQPVQLDVPRTWRFAAALIAVAPQSLQRMFIVEHVRSMLLDHARRVHAPAAQIARFEDITCQPEAPHDDHLHIRLYCTPEDMRQGCLDSLPTYPFRVQALAALKLTPLIASAYKTPEQRRARAARTTTPAEARKKAGPMHRDVVAFLNERESWLQQPHPGRPYCR